MYGPTEAAIHCTLVPRIHSTSNVGNIGIPLDTVSAFVIRPASDSLNTNPGEVEILQKGEVGELAMGGYQLARCYLNRPEQTAEAFFQTKDYGQLYRTGDKARFCSDGTFECLGRLNSSQVKLRGQRVELGEIEHVIFNTSDVSNVVAKVINGLLICFVIIRGASISSIDVLTNCRQRLPGFMIPAEVLIMSEFPQLPSGKVDRSTLEIQYKTLRESPLPDTDYPAHELEQKISNAVKEVLGFEIGPDSSLAAAGLDSLRAIRLSSRLRELKVPIEAFNIMKTDTIQIIAKDIEASHPPSSSTYDLSHDISGWKFIDKGLIPQITKMEDGLAVEDVIRCTPMQIGMLGETLQIRPAYCNRITLEFSSPLETSALISAFLKIAERNAILRTVFVQSQDTDSIFLQVILDHLPQFVFSEVPEFQPDWTLTDHAPILYPLRIQIQRYTLGSKALIQIHHSVYDGWSWDLMMIDLNLILGGIDPPRRSQFRDIVPFTFQAINSEEYTRSIDYFAALLQDFNPKSFPPFDNHVENGQSVRTEELQTKIGLEGLERVSKRLRVSSQSIIQAVFAYILGSYVGSSDTIFGVVSSGRNLPVDGVEEIVGPLLSTLPIRANIAHCRSAQDLILLINGQNRMLLKHHVVSLRDIRKACDLSPKTKLFDALFIWQQSLHNTSNQSYVHQVDATDFLEFGLVLEVEPIEGHVLFKVNYESTLISQDQVSIMLRQIEQLSISIVKDPMIIIENLPRVLDRTLLSSTETHVILWSQKGPEMDVVNDERSMNSSLERERDEPSNPLPIGAIGEIHILKESPDQHPQSIANSPNTRSGKSGRMLPNGSIQIMENVFPTFKRSDLQDSDTEQIKGTLLRVSKDTPSSESNRSNLEQAITRTISNATNIPSSSISRHTSFFKLGIDSISAIALSKSLRDQNLGNVDVAMILEHHTIAALSQEIERTALYPTSESAPTLDFSNVFSQEDEDRIRSSYGRAGKALLKILPCTPLQEAMLSTSQTDNKRAYTNSTTFKVNGDLRQLQEAWKVVVSRQQILRTVFVTTENRDHPFAQIVLRRHTIKWKKANTEKAPTDLEDLENDRPATTPLDNLEPPYEFTILMYGKETRLLLLMHHALYDAIAFELLLKEVSLVYQGLQLAPVVPIEPFLRDVLSMDQEQSMSFWKKKLREFQPQALPRKENLTLGTAISTNRNGVSRHICKRPLHLLQQDIRAISASLLGVTQACWIRVLSLLTGSVDVCFGNVMSGRTLNIDGLDRLISPCFNTVPVRVRLSEHLSNAQLIGELLENNRDTLAYQFTPLRRIQAAFGLGKRRLFDTLFLLQEPHDSLDASIWTVENDIGQMDFPIVLETVPIGSQDHLELLLHFDRNIFTNLEANMVLIMLENFLGNALSFPAAMTSDASFLGQPLLEFASCISDRQSQSASGNDPPSSTSLKDHHVSSVKTGWTETQSSIREVYAKLSGVSEGHIGLETSIFRLALDSISSVQAVPLLKRKGINVSAADVLEVRGLPPMLIQIANDILVSYN
jgi:non-ribosomal peptide synthetase component F/aryl carrier-like protein